MANGSPKYIGSVRPGQFIPQEGSEFVMNELGYLDSGTRIFLTHPSTKRAEYPRIGTPDRTFPFMRVAGGIVVRKLECTLNEITVPYRGLLDIRKPHRLTPGCDTSVFTLPIAPGSSEGTSRLVAQVPVPTLTREYVTFTQPTFTGVGNSGSAPFLPAPPAFSLSFTPDPAEPATLNYHSNAWVLSSRTWEELGTGFWVVLERYTYFFNIAA